MFSIAAINDADSKAQWEPLAPTKEAQEFHLSQTYHQGLVKFQAKDYEKARELLESVLEDPLLAPSVQVDDGHILQLRFLALKNLASVFLQQGAPHYESALNCYLQAAEIDNKDSVIWNQLGTLSCSMGLLCVSRWAFEQGLSCSPNNWNCMEKLLEVLIAIADEVACLSVAHLILRHWPSHSRALHVKKTIEDSQAVPFAPKGIDKLEPKHVRLKFAEKRKATDGNFSDGHSRKKLKQNLELHLPEASWVSLSNSLLDVLLQLNHCNAEESSEEVYRSGDIRLAIKLSSALEDTSRPEEKKWLNSTPTPAIASSGYSNCETPSTSKEKDSNIIEEQPHERRSSRLERLRKRKPGKEDLDFAIDKDQAKVVIQYLEPFVADETRISGAVSRSFSFSDQVNHCDYEHDDVCEFLRNNENNFGAYHMSHLLLEDVASRGLVYQEAFVKFLDLEKMTRLWGKERTATCNLFLSELYYDLGSSSADSSRASEFMQEASYHLCKIIELVALRNEHGDKSVESQGNDEETLVFGSSFQCLPPDNDFSFWVRFFWLSGRLSILDGNKEKAHKEFSISFALLEEKKSTNDSLCPIRLPYCKVIKEISEDMILHQINILKVDFLMEKTLTEMIQKEMYKECMALLAPLLFCTKDVHLHALSLSFDGEGIPSLELSALDILLKACEKIRPMDIEVYLNCHRRKLQMLVAMTGPESFNAKSGPKEISASDVELKESSGKCWNVLVLEEVKAISKCVSQIKNFIDLSNAPDDIAVPKNCTNDIQSLLLSVMCNVAGIFTCKRSSGLVIEAEIEKSCFVEAAIAMCKLQHLDLMVPVKTQVDLIVATHDLLAEYGLCCAGEDGSGEEGLFLKFSIKHLLALDVKLKSNYSDKTSDCIEQPHDGNLSQDVDMAKEEVTVPSQSVSPHKTTDTETTSNAKLKASDQLTEGECEFTEDEKEELELKIDTALDQCFFCLYGLNIRSDASYEDDLVTHRNTSRGDYQTKEQCADVFQYILPCAKASSSFNLQGSVLIILGSDIDVDVCQRTGLIKLRRVLRAIRKHFLQPPEDILAGNAVDTFLNDHDLCEDKLSEEAGSDGFLKAITKAVFTNSESFKHHKMSLVESSEPYLEVYSNLYYFLSLSEEMSATDKWPGFVLTKEGEEFVQHNANLFKYDLLYNPQRFESWQRLATIYDEEVDLLLNDGSKHINVSGWRKNATLPQRVETSRRRSRRCLLMSLALAKTSAQQCEIHELLALVYYDSLQNVVPFYDQRSVVPPKEAVWVMFCENSMRHFKKAFAHKQDWSHAYYIGKLCEKLGFPSELSLSYYDKAVTLNPTAVDPVYRMHASRLKILFKCGKQNLEALKAVSAYAFSEANRDYVKDILDKIDADNSQKDTKSQDDSGDIKHEDLLKLEVWRLLYDDCVCALEACIEGDLKHFHKARYMLAQGLYKRGDTGDFDKAKEELSFCFKSSRSSFTINMWEIDSTVKKGRRKTPGASGGKKILEVNLPESSRKFITCIRKYLLFYLKLLEEAGDISTLERAYVSLRADKRFSLCVEDLVPVALGKYVQALVSSIQSTAAPSSSEQMLEKLFTLFIEQGNLLPDVCSLPETKSLETSEISLYGYLHEHINSLERNGKLEALEAINEKIRKRFKNSKSSNPNCAKVCRHASVAWCRALLISLGDITPRDPMLCEQDNNASEAVQQFLCVDLQNDELWSSAFEDPTRARASETKFSKILFTIVKKVSDENAESANTLLKSAYNFYRESSCVMPPSGLNLYMVPSWVALEQPLIRATTNGVEILDLSVPRKLILWAYTLLHGRYANISAVVKHCEESLKSKMKKGGGASAPTPSVTQTAVGGAKVNDATETDGNASATAFSSSGLQLHRCNSVSERRDSLGFE